MQNRREFLVKSVGATAAVAAAGLIQTACAPPPKPVAIGYGVGEMLPPIVGPNQYGGTSSSADYRGSWVLIDLCPWWCAPCTASAVHHAEFLRNARAAGIDLRLLPVVLEDFSNNPSERHDAENWTARFGLFSEIALHCDGNAASPLRHLAEEFATANGASAATYPTYVLVDPKGVVRHFQGDSNLGMVQTKLTEFTGTPLTGDWPIGAPVTPNISYPVVGNVTAVGKLADGVAFDETNPFGEDGEFVTVGRGYWSVIAPGLSDFTGTLSNVAMPFDPDTATTLTIGPGSPTHGFGYSRLSGFTAPIAIVPDDAWLPTSIDESKVIHAEGTVVIDAERAVLTIPPTGPLLGPGRYSRAIAIMPTLSPGRHATPYALTHSLPEDLGGTGIAPGDAAAITATLQTVAGHLAGMRFADASTAAQQVVAQALAAEAGFNFHADAELLVALLDTAAAGL